MSKTIGQKLKEIRDRLKISTTEMSKRCGITVQKINFYELDKGMPTIPTLQKLAKGLDCTIFDIIDEPLGRTQSKCIHASKCMFYNREIQGEETNDY